MKRLWVRGMGWLAIGTLAAAFAVSGWRVAQHSGNEDRNQGGPKVLRIAHSRLETGAREALAAVARDYEALHPGVAVEFMAVPDRLYVVWLRTKLLSADAPDIFELSGTLASDVLLRSFVPLSRAVRTPNHYNAGTALAELAWRETFWDGITSVPAYDANYATVLGIPGTLLTTRLYVNADLWAQHTAGAPLPRTWAELVAGARLAQGRSGELGRPLIPVAAAGETANALIAGLAASQTQRFALSLEPTRRLEAHAADIVSQLIAGRWSLTDPPVLDALHLVREALDLLPPGALQLRRDDALFYFTQGRALALPGSSFDVATVRAQSPFRVVIIPVPWPDTTDPRFGRNVLGPAYEAARAGQMAFGVTRRSSQPERAIDFLRYLTSVPGATRFAEVSGWLPPIIGVRPVAEAEAFMPAARGYPAGFSLGLMGETNRVFTTNLYRLTSAEADVTRFARDLSPAYLDAAAQDVRRIIRQVLANVAIHDTTLGAHWLLGEFEPERAQEHSERVAELTETQIFQEEATYRRLLDLAEAAVSDRPTSP